MMSNTGRQRLIAELEHQLSPKGVRKRQRARMWRTGSWLFLIRAAAVVRRLADVLLAALLVFLLSPVLVLLFAAAKMSGGGIARVERLGRWATTFGQYRFSFGRNAALSRRPFLAGLPGLFNVLRGEMASIGHAPTVYVHLHQLDGNIRFIGKNQDRQRRHGGRPVELHKFFPSNDRRAAIDDDGLSADVTPGIRGEQKRHALEVVRPAELAERRVVDEPLLPLRKRPGRHP